MEKIKQMLKITLLVLANSVLALMAVFLLTGTYILVDSWRRLGPEQQIASMNRALDDVVLLSKVELEIVEIVEIIQMHR